MTESQSTSFPAGATLLTGLRIATGISFLFIGIAKFTRPLAPGMAAGIGGFEALLAQIGVPFPALHAWAITTLEVVGGVLLLVNVATPIVASLLAVEMAVAFATVGVPAMLGRPVHVAEIPVGTEGWRQPLELGLLAIASMTAWRERRRIRLPWNRRPDVAL